MTILDNLSVSGLCFPESDLASTLDQLGRLEVPNTTLMARKVAAQGWDSGVGTILSSGMSVAALIESPIPLADQKAWADGRSRLIDTLDAAHALGTPAVYMPSGRRPAAKWDDCVGIFIEAMDPVLLHAEQVGIKVAVEPTSWLYSDVSFVHSVRAAKELVGTRSLGICVDLFHVWADMRLDDELEKGSDDICLVQVSDYVFGDRALSNRAVPGDGDIPLSEMLSWLAAGGYRGIIDLELSGPRIDAEGEFEAARRGLSALRALLVGDRD